MRRLELATNILYNSSLELKLGLDAGVYALRPWH